MTEVIEKQVEQLQIEQPAQPELSLEGSVAESNPVSSQVGVHVYYRVAY